MTTDNIKDVEFYKDIVTFMETMVPPETIGTDISICELVTFDDAYAALYSLFSERVITDDTVLFVDGEPVLYGEIRGWYFMEGQTLQFADADWKWEIRACNPTGNNCPACNAVQQRLDHPEKWER